MRLLLVPIFAIAAMAQSGGTDFARDVAPLLESHCIACHSAERAAGGLAITGRQNLLDKHVLVPGKPEASSLYTAAALPSDKRGAMPPGGPHLSDAQLTTLKNWIAAGAVWPASVALKTQPVTSDKPGDEHALVAKIRERIEARAKEGPKTGSKYSVTVPNSTVTYDMVPIAGGEFTMGASDNDTAAGKVIKQKRSVCLKKTRRGVEEIT